MSDVVSSQVHTHVCVRRAGEDISDDVGNCTKRGMAKLKKRLAIYVLYFYHIKY